MNKIIRIRVILIILILLVFQFNLFSWISSGISLKIIDDDNLELLNTIVKVYKLSDDFLSFEEISKGITDKKGEFNFIDLKKGYYFVRAFNRGYIPVNPDFFYGHIDFEELYITSSPINIYNGIEHMKRALSVFFLAEGKIMKIILIMKRGGMIEGKIQIRMEQEVLPLQSSILLLRKQAENEIYFKNKEILIARTTTNEDGSFKIENISPNSNYFIKIQSFNSVEQKIIEGISVNVGQSTLIEETYNWSSINGVKGIIKINNEIPDSGSIRLLSDKGDFITITYMQKNGQYLLGEISPGKYLIEYSASKFDHSLLKYITYKKKMIQNISAGKILTININFNR